MDISLNEIIPCIHGRNTTNIKFCMDNRHNIQSNEINQAIELNLNNNLIKYRIVYIKRKEHDCLLVMRLHLQP